MNCYRNIALWLIVAGMIGLPTAATEAAVPTAEQPAELSVGEPAPGFDLPLLNGKKVTLGEFQGKAVLVVFWRSG
jgi:cytochrome oxidase Cu insertion factor (SCO1/SenC/PrrC family)